MEALSDKLKSLGVQIGARNIPPHSVKDRKSILRLLDVFDGVEETTPFGTACKLVNDYPGGYFHGTIQLHATSAEILTRWAGINDIVHPESLLFLDAETSGLSGGTGTLVFMVGFGFFFNNGFRIIQYFLDEPSSEPALLSAIFSLSNSYTTSVSFNGKSFDVPLLTTRFTLNRITSPFRTMHHIDLLHLARRLWRYRFTNRALGELEREILGVVRTQEEVPGWMVPQIYLDYLRTGDTDQLAGVFYHNQMDILSLAGLHVYLSDWAEDFKKHIENPVDTYALAIFLHEMGLVENAKSLYLFCINSDLPREYHSDALLRLGNIYRKVPAWSDAVSLWETAAGLGNTRACVELAKYCEHQTRDIEQAKEWSQKARLLLEANSCPNISCDDLIHRIDRLNRKLLMEKEQTND